MLVLTLMWLQTNGSDQLASARIILALLCVVVASSLALGIAVGLSRRIQLIGNQGEAKPAVHEHPADSAPPQLDHSDDL